ncbi:MAG: hypothetical protein M0P73_09675 [Syntrophobacterales bacterium]|jgi:surface carbohydrate biosynthesis protein (TIGR04326 family)|nr:hypothetical protein [Syntrophobacterales bacterium]
MQTDYKDYMVLLDEGAAWTGPPPRVLAYWAAMDIPSGCESIPLGVDRQSPQLRQEYLAWVHELRAQVLKGRTVQEHLRLEGRDSFWWLTLIAEKSPMKSPAIFEVLKLRVLEKLYRNQGCRGLIWVSANREIQDVLRDWCRSLGHSYEWRRLADPGKPSLRDRLKRLPQPMRALAYLAEFWWRRRRLVTAAPDVPGGGRQATIVTYFPNIDPGQAEKGIFLSRYWGRLHRVLAESPWTINWVWFFAPSVEYTFAQALRLRRRFTETAGGRARYFFLEEFLPFKSLLKAVGLYMQLGRRRFTLRSVSRAFHFPGSDLNFWPVLARDWRNSLSGWAAMEGCLAWVSFRELAARLPRQEWGLYPWENQAWERPLNTAWPQEGHGKLMGFQHVSLRYLDLRSFEDPRSYTLGPDAPPLPEVLAMGGLKDKELLEETKFPSQGLAMVEALRYMNLSQQPVESSLPSVASGGKTLLVVTGYMVSETASQLRLLAQAAQGGGLAGYEHILVKPHPYCPVDGILQALTPPLQVEIVNESLGKLWSRATAVYAANSTSASVEAVCLGLPVLVHIPENSLNLSPLRGKAAVQHVGTAADLIKGLAARESVTVNISDFFNLDQGLPGWRRLLTEGEPG